MLDGTAFEQDGVLFDAAGDEMGQPKTKTPDTKPDKGKVSDQVAKQMAG